LCDTSRAGDPARSGGRRWRPARAARPTATSAAPRVRLGWPEPHPCQV